MTDEPVPDREPDDENQPEQHGGPANKGSAEDPWEPQEQRYADRPEQGSRPNFRSGGDQ